FAEYVSAVTTTVALLLILSALRPLERRLLRGHLRTVVLQLEKGQKVSQVMEVVEDCAIETESVEVSRRRPQPAVTITLRGGAGDAQRLVTHASLHGIHAVEETDPQHPPFP
ncbi:MAG: hypothetical protein JOZ15_15370, partial [Acidobacteria bacterium]|nr:hypothetical protein [Acidobacteriota bacterium]